MRDLILILFIGLFVLASFRRPYFMALGYIWVDFLQPQTLTYWFLNSAPVALIMALGALAFYAFFDKKHIFRISLAQVLILLFALYATINTYGWAVVEDHAFEKWDWVWKGLAFSVFLPFVLTTRRRVEAAAFTMILSLSAITISGGIKTLLGSGGYGTVSFLVKSNSGLYEGSTLATVSLAFVPITLWLYKHNTIVPRNIITKLATAGIVFAMLLVTVGAEARTGLVAGAILAAMLWLVSKHKVLYAVLMLAAGAAAIPMLPSSFTDRMSTIQTFDEDTSASTRIAVWKWTIDYVADNPLGGGFGVYRINSFDVDVKRRTGDADNMNVSEFTVKENARAFHNSIFEVLGELGYPGLLLYLSIIMVALKSAWSLKNARTGDAAGDAWHHDLGQMMVISMLVYLAGSMFVGIAFQPPYYDLLAITIAASHIARRERLGNKGDEKFGPGKRAPVSSSPDGVAATT